MGFKNSVEYLYLCLMRGWEKSAPPDGHQGWIGERAVRNTQISRMARVLTIIAAGNEDAFYQRLAGFTRRDDGNSYISKDSSWMHEPYALSEGWFFEGCTSLVQKQEIIDQLRKFDTSATFIACADDFVAGNSVEKYEPSAEEAEEILQRSIEAAKRS